VLSETQPGARCRTEITVCSRSRSTSSTSRSRASPRSAHLRLQSKSPRDSVQQQSQKRELVKSVEEYSCSEGETCTVDDLERRIRCGCKNAFTDGNLTDEQFIRVLCTQSDEFQKILRNCGMESYIEEWTELIHDTCMDYAKLSNASWTGQSTLTPSDLTTSMDGPKHSFHSPALGEMSRLAAKMRRRLLLAQSTDLRLVNCSIAPGQAPEEKDSDQVLEKYQKFKTRVANFMDRVSDRVNEVKEQGRLRNSERGSQMSFGNQTEDSEGVTLPGSPTFLSLTPTSPRTLSFRTFIGELRSREVTQQVPREEQQQETAMPRSRVATDRCDVLVKELRDDIHRQMQAHSALRHQKSSQDYTFISSPPPKQTSRPIFRSQSLGKASEHVGMKTVRRIRSVESKFPTANDLHWSMAAGA